MINRGNMGKELWVWLEAILGNIPGSIGTSLRANVYGLLFSSFRGKKVRIGLFTHIRFPWNVEFGKNIFIGRNAYINCLHSGDLRIGSNVMIAPYSMIITTRHDPFTSAMLRPLQRVASRKVIIDDDVWIGGNSIVLPGTRIGKGSIVSTSSVIKTDVPSFAIAGGNPARIWRCREDQNKESKNGLPSVAWAKVGPVKHRPESTLRRAKQ